MGTQSFEVSSFGRTSRLASQRNSVSGSRVWSSRQSAEALVAACAFLHAGRPNIVEDRSDMDNVRCVGWQSSR
eukprot:3172220-Pyramimonas_sp.AAC.1